MVDKCLTRMEMPVLTPFLTYALPLVIGWSADRLWGDPERLPHPIVGFGRWIAWGERHLNRGEKRELKGALFCSGSILLLFLAVSFLLREVADWNRWLAGAVTSLGVFYCLSGETLRREVRAVFRAVERSTEEGRRQISRIVGRDTSTLSPDQIRTAALETLSENLSDGVVAPLFWYLVLGLPGMITYKLINTFDSMVGYKTDRYRLFGRWPARIDDAANYLPARLTALLMVTVAGRPSLLAFVRRYGPQHASPNAGYPEAALAGILDCRFGGPNRYFGQLVEKPYIGTNPRRLTTEDLHTALAINLRTEVAMLAVCCIFVIVIHWI